MIDPSDFCPGCGCLRCRCIDEEPEEIRDDEPCTDRKWAAYEITGETASECEERRSRHRRARIALREQQIRNYDTTDARGGRDR